MQAVSKEVKKIIDFILSLIDTVPFQVITREAIHYGLADSSLKASLINWALPYAQRYIYNLHHDRYCQLKQTGFENLSHLQIVVVEKLFYRNVLTRSGVSSKKRFECSCLLLVCNPDSILVFMCSNV